MVIGVGNVAIDCARVLVKTPAEMSHTDIATNAADDIHASPLEDVYMVGRRGPIDAKFTNVELREMGELEECTPIIDGSVIPDEVPEDMEMSDRDRRLKDRNLGTLRSFVDADPAGRKRRVHFQFYASPVEILGGDKVEIVQSTAVGIYYGGAALRGEKESHSSALPLAGKTLGDLHVHFNSKGQGLVVKVEVGLVQ